MTLSLFVKVTAKDGKRDEFVAAFKPMLRHVEDNEPGTLSYALVEDPENPNVLWLYEEYTDQAAFDAHVASDAMAELMPSFGELGDGAPEVARGTRVLPDPADG